MGGNRDKKIANAMSGYIETFAYENGFKEYFYYQRLCRFDFNDFNEIYESNILKKIGKIMNFIDIIRLLWYN